MNKGVTFFFAALISFSCNHNSTENKAALFSIELKLLNDSVFFLSEIKNNKASVFVFLAPDCPLSQNYTLTLNNIFSQFKNDSIIFYSIIPGKDFDKKDVNEFVSKYKINSRVLIDRDLILTRYLDATKTPEVFVITSAGNVAYKGAIDNWAVDLGQHRKVITEDYLEDALNNIKDNKEVQIKETQAVGCFIERKR